MVDLLARNGPIVVHHRLSGVVHAIEWLLHCRYLQIEEMADLRPPELNAPHNNLPRIAATNLTSTTAPFTPS